MLNIVYLFQIIAVCDFLNYLKYIERGLVKSSGNQLIENLSKFYVNISNLDFFF